MSRKLSNWLRSYQDYAADGYCPPAFHLWTGLSVLAGALERKVWVSQGRIHHYPNIFVLLVSHAGVGKSTALLRGVDFLEDLKVEHNPNLLLIPEQVTEPGLLDMLKIRQEMIFRTPGKETIFYHTSGYFYASEASSSALQNLFGNFNATITALYDCPKFFRKKLKGEKETTEIVNACFNLMAGATFDYLKNLVNETTVMGGLASRFTYVISKERKVREANWNAEFIEDTAAKEALLADLSEIHKLQGRFKPTPGFIAAWERTLPEIDREIISLNSPRMESLMIRKATNAMKVAMLLSVAESDSLILEERHWDESMELINEVTKDYAFILSQAAMADRSSQSGLNQVIGQALKAAGGTMPIKILRGAVLAHGSNADHVSKTIDYMLNSSWLSVDSSGIVTLLVDPDRYL
jgi:hypothetical protein